MEEFDSLDSFRALEALGSPSISLGLEEVDLEEDLKRELSRENGWCFFPFTLLERVEPTYVALVLMSTAGRPHVDTSSFNPQRQ